MKRKVKWAAKVALGIGFVFLLFLLMMIGMAWVYDFGSTSIWKLIKLAVQVDGGWALVMMLITLQMKDEEISKNSLPEVAKSHFWFSLFLGTIFMAIACVKGLIKIEFFSLEMLLLLLGCSFIFAIIIMIVEISCEEEEE